MTQPSQKNTALEGLRAIAPTELKLYIVLLCLSGPSLEPVETSLSKLAYRTGLSYSTVHQAARRLCRKGHIKYRPGENQHRLSRFEIARLLAALRFGVAGQEATGAERSLKIGKKSPGSTKKREAVSVSNINLIKTDTTDYTDTPKGRKFIEDFRPRNKKEVLALEIAEALGDREGLALYLSYCKRYPESVILRAYGEAKEVPFRSIRKSRGALFTYLVQKYAAELEK